MAAIDFPASPTTGQLFSAANGVTYQYNGTLWLVQAGPGGGTGDFVATHNATFAVSAGGSYLALNTVTSGNSGLWYNTTNGRYTPPAGRYQLFGMFSGAGAGGGVVITCYFRKNGVALPNQSGSINTPSTGLTGAVSNQAIVDANGSDYFELFGYANVATTSGCNANFGAFPLTGMQGPMGPPFSKPTMQLDNEVVLAAPAASMTVTIPSGAKAIEIWFCTNNVGSVNDATGLILNDVQSGAPNVGLNHNAQALYGSATTAGANALSAANGWNMGGVQMAFWGVMRVIFGPVYNIMISADYQFTNAAGTHYKEQLDMFGGNAGTTGFRLQNGSGTQFVTGSYMRVFAVQ